MMKPMEIYRPFEVVVVPFPFTDKAASKRRPALVLSSERFNSAIHHSVLAMITSQAHSAWPLDIVIQDLSMAGLKSPSIIRMKLFTLDHRLIQKRIGHLGQPDQRSVKTSFKTLFP